MTKDQGVKDKSATIASPEIVLFGCASMCVQMKETPSKSVTLVCLCAIAIEKYVQCSIASISARSCCLIVESI